MANILELTPEVFWNITARECNDLYQDIELMMMKLISNKCKRNITPIPNLFISLFDMNGNFNSDWF